MCRAGGEPAGCPPHSHDRLCPQIYFWEAQRQNVTERVKTLFLAESGVKLKNLTGYTAYMVSVAAFNAAGDGPRSTPTRAQTQQAGGGSGWRGGGQVGRGRAEEVLPGLCSSGSGSSCLIPVRRDWGWVPRPQEMPSRVGEHSPQRGLRVSAQKRAAVHIKPWREPPALAHPPPILPLAAHLADGQSTPCQPTSAPCLAPT